MLGSGGGGVCLISPARYPCRRFSASALVSSGPRGGPLLGVPGFLIPAGRGGGDVHECIITRPAFQRTGKRWKSLESAGKRWNALESAGIFIGVDQPPEQHCHQGAGGGNSD